MTRIRIITPLCSMSESMTDDTLAEVRPLEAHGITCDDVTVGVGPDSVEGHFDEALTAAHVAIEAMTAEREGFDAVIIDCMGDPGMMAAREVVSIPVVGPGEASLHLAAMIGNRISCVSILDSVRPIFHAHAKVYGLDKLVSVRTIGMGVMELEKNPTEVPNLLLEQSMHAIKADLADVIILGCTGFVGVAETLESRLRDAGFEVPVINPLPVAALMADLMVKAGVRHSPAAYHRANLKKQILGYTIPGKDE